MKLSILTLLLATAVAHEMAHEMAHESDHHEVADSTNSTETPVPHVMHHMHGVPILQTDLLPLEREFWENYNATNYANYPSANKPAMYLYLSLMTIAFVFVNPVLMMINNLNPLSFGYLVGLFVNSGIILVGLLNYSVFMGSIPDLYPGNVLTKFNWIYLFTVIAQFVFAVLKFGALKSHGTRFHSYKSLESDFDSNHLGSPSTLYDSRPEYRTESPCSFESPRSFDLNERTLSPSPELSNDITVHLNYFKSNGRNWLLSWLSSGFVSKVVNFMGFYSVIMFNLLNWFNFLFFFVYVPTLAATFGLLGQGNKIFNLLAHFIKGGVFFMLGLLTLARYCGAYQNKGWAWNYKFVYGDAKEGSLTGWERIQPCGLITMEWIESFLIFFYGSTNVFMEHLANPGGEWTAKDLEHVSIAFIFLGCGICGLITENKLSTWRYNYSNQSSKSDRPVIKSSPGFSPNPFPILCIFWTGLLMSQHQQASELSTKIHSQWGNILVYGTMFRFLTYLISILMPKTNVAEFDNTKPSQPITELLASFALLAGGLIFMESCDPVVLALEYRGFDAMFTLNLSLGFVFLLMAWIMGCFQVKNWYAKRYMS